MTEEIKQLDDKIQKLRQIRQNQEKISKVLSGYNVAVTIITNLLGCIFVGLSIGILLQLLFHTSALLTAGLTLLGGVAGLYSTVRYGLDQERKLNK